MELIKNFKNTMSGGMNSMEDAMKERLDMLLHREKSGSLSDRDRDELQQLRQRIGMKNGE